MGHRIYNIEYRIWNMGHRYGTFSQARNHEAHSNRLQSPAAVAPGAKPPDQTWLGQLTHATFTG